MIRAGDVELVVTGGMESMSNAPYALAQARFGYRLGDGTLIDLMVHDGLVSTLRRPAHGRAGVVRRPRARHLARGAGRLGAPLARSARSRRRTPAASRDEIVAGRRARRRRGAAPRHVAREARGAEAGVRPGRARRPPATRPGVNDGASCVVVASEEWARRRGIEPLATILAQGYVADEFAYLARTPAKAGGDRARAAPARRSATSSASRSTRRSPRSRAHSTRLLGADEELVNVNGGAVALGHPIGASGGADPRDARARAAPRRAAGSGWRRSARAAARATRSLIEV